MTRAAITVAANAIATQVIIFLYSGSAATCQL
jgi:hypothetical protein